MSRAKERVQGKLYGRSLLMAGALGVICSAAGAQTLPSSYTEYTERLRYSEVTAPLADDLFGDQVSLYDGTISFATTDASLPGNNALPVAIGRRYEVDRPGNKLLFGNWDLDLPYLSGLFGADSATVAAGYWAPAARCSSGRAPPTVKVWNSRGTQQIQMYAMDYWNGNRLSLPGGGGGELLVPIDDARRTFPQDGRAYPFTTRDGWHFSCLSSLQSGQAGEGFLAHAPDGTQYAFDWMVVRNANNPAHKQLYESVTRGILQRNEVRLYPSQVTDRFGNWVRYEWEGSQLRRLHSSDGRAMELAYDANGRIASIGAAGRTWTYAYDETGQLTTVTLPDGTQWHYVFNTYPVQYKYPTTQGEPWTNYQTQYHLCTRLNKFAEQEKVLTVTHPSGALGEFIFQPQRHGRMGVPFDCQETGANGTMQNGWNWTPVYKDTHSIAIKRISGAGLAPQAWSYAFTSLEGRYDRDVTAEGMPFFPVGSAPPKYTTVTAPDGTQSVYEFGKEVGVNDGRLLSVATVVGGQVVRREETVYYPEHEIDGAPFAGRAGNSLYGGADRGLAEWIRPVVRSSVSQGRVDFHSEVLQFDAHARALKVRSSNSAGHSRTDTNEYHDDAARWVLGQVKRQVNDETGLEVSRSEFDPELVLPTHAYAFGRLMKTATYHADGTLAALADGNGNTTTLADWKGGVPGRVTHPDGAVHAVQVNDSGWVVQTTDENGYSTGYGYDAMGRITSIVHPSSEGGTAWHPVTQAFEWVGGDEYGIPAGHWRQTVSNGNARKITYLDALWRPLLVREYDAANEAGTQRFQRYAYDHEGRTTFASYPSADGHPTTGTWTEYDALGRTTSVSQDSEHGLLTTTTEYLDGLLVRTTSPKGIQTLTRYQAWDKPSYDLPIIIDRASGLPEQSSVDIQRDIFGKPSAITKRDAGGTISLTRHYVYDAHQQLCKSIEPETGATILAYDGAGNVAWSASGHHELMGAGTCNQDEAYAGGRRIDRTYDTRNRLLSLTFPDGVGNQEWSYTPDGLPAQIKTRQDADTTVINAYSYDARRHVIGESSSQVDGGQNVWYLWGAGYGYNGEGNVATQSYPSGLIVDYAPNALGQPTQVGSFASDVHYHPNGTVRQFIYGNGVQYVVTQNARMLPDSINSQHVQHYVYEYDDSGNPIRIHDQTQGGDYSRLMEYDGIDRLAGVGSVSFGGNHWHRFSYDALDNMTSWTLGGVKDYAHYDYDPASRRLAGIRDSAGNPLMTLAYDAQGNLQQRNDQAYQFDYGNRLRDVVGREYYRYDGHGRRVYSGRASTYTVSMYGHDGKLLYDHRRNNPLKASDYVYLGNRLIAQREWDEGTNVTRTRYHHTDALGSPVAETDEAGTVVDRTQWEPYGAAIGKPTYDGVGFTGHVQDGTTGLTYMQQRYYDPDVGTFLSVDPITALHDPIRMFSRYSYASGNPYRFKDPDGRAPCTGTRIGTCVGGETVAGLSSAQVRAVQKNPQRYVDRLNQIENRHSSEQKSAHYFSRVSRPVTAATGREVGADIANTGAGVNPFTVTNFKLGDGNSVDAGQAYGGPGVRVAIIHTHPGNKNFSGAGNAVWDEGWRGSFATGGDMERALSAGVNAYVSLPGGDVLKFDFERMSSDRSAGGPLNAIDYITRLP
jgi:RHS repeat-associated protein